MASAARIVTAYSVFHELPVSTATPSKAFAPCGVHVAVTLAPVLAKLEPTLFHPTVENLAPSKAVRQKS
jgi:hypothetical protein